MSLAPVLRRHSVLLACLATALVHAFWVSPVLAVDEGGYAVIARYWTDPGPYLYGPFWVDRPPVLLGLFAIGVNTGPYGVRVIALLVAVLLVAAVAAAAHAVGGRSAARWAAWVGFALACSTQIDTNPLNGELAAGMFVAVSIACVLRAVQPARVRRTQLLWGAAGGVAAALAPLAKQNFADGLAFAGVFLLLALTTRANRERYGNLLPTVAAFGAGGLLVLLGTLLWASMHHGIGALAYAMYGFRRDATGVMLDRPLDEQISRLQTLVGVGAACGLLVMLVLVVVCHGGRLRRLSPLPWALLAAGLVAVVGIVGGVNFFVHYLVGLIPVVAIAAGIAAQRGLRGWRLVRLLTVAMVVVSLFFSARGAARTFHQPRVGNTVGQWVARSSHPGDTIVVPYTRANVVANSGLRPGYVYLWVLPTATLDPDLRLFLAGLRAPRVGTPAQPGQRSAPTWFVRWDDLQLHGLDSGHQVERALRRHYHVAGVICGHRVYLHDGVGRTLGPPPDRAECGLA